MSDAENPFDRMLSDAAHVLGMDPQAAREQRAVKRAYAAMLKRHRPDQDPEGFRRVRDAYELLNVVVHRTEQGIGEPPAVTVEPTVEAAQDLPERPVDDALAQAISRLTALCAATQEESSLVDAGSQVWRLARMDHLARGLAALGTAFGERPHLLGQVLGDEGLLIAFANERGDLTAAVLQYWTGHDTLRLATFAKELLLHLGKGNGEFALLGLRLAEVLALREPAVAESLLNRLFLDLPPQMRGATLGVEQRVLVGRQLVGLPLPTRQFLWEAIDHDSSTPAPVVPAGVLQVLEALPASHPVRALLRDVMPDLKLGFNWGGSAATGSKPMQVYTRRDSYHAAREVDSSGPSSWRLPFGVALVLFMLMSAAIRNAPTHAPPPPAPLIRNPQAELYRPDYSKPAPLPPALDPRSIRIPYGESQMTPQQREAILRLLEQSRQKPPPSRQDSLRVITDGADPRLLPSPAPGKTPVIPEVER